jgi:site-specific recombinase XerD
MQAKPQSAALVPAVVVESSLSLPLPELEAARDFAKASKAPRTLDEYKADWRRFEAWAKARNVRSMPAEPAAVAAYLAHLATTGKRYATISRSLASISVAHKAAGHESPRKSASVSLALQGIARSVGTAPVNQKAPTLVADLRAMVRTLPVSLIGTRDRALLLVGFAAALRRSELVGLDVADLAFTDDGLEVTLRRSKTDQEGQGRKIGVPYGSDPSTCPIRSLQAWLRVSGITAGAIFRSVRHGAMTDSRLRGADVASVVKRTAKAAGLDAAHFAGHSLRAGLATSAAKAGKSERVIMRTTGHKSIAMVRRYIRDADLFSENAAAGIGL